jgi:hypothetical protein
MKIGMSLLAHRHFRRFNREETHPTFTAAKRLSSTEALERILKSRAAR